MPRHDTSAVGDAAQLDGSGGGAGLCTLSMREWQDLCGRGGLPDARACDLASRGDWRGVLSLQLRATPELREMLFQRDPWALRAVSELETALSDGATPEEAMLVEVIAGSFSGCFDAGLLAPPVATPLCEAAGSGDVRGVESARCAALDGPCQRGYFDGARGCCDVHYAVPGASCETGGVDSRAGACDEARTCQAGGEVARANPYAWSETLPIATTPRRVGDWYVTGPDGEVTHAVLRLSHTADGTDPHRAERVVERGLVRVPFDSAGRVTVAAMDSASNGVDGVLLATVRPGRRTLLIERSAERATSATLVTISRAPMSSIGFLGVDGSTIPAGLTETISCDGSFDPGVASRDEANSEIRCGVTPEGLVAVEAPGLTAAFIAVPGGRFDIRPAGHFTPPAAAGETEPDEVRFPDVRERRFCPARGRSCRTSCGTLGYQTCSGAGAWSPCVRPESCNAADDDCDGRVDETGNALCNDGMSCTVDRCVTRLRPGGGFGVRLTAACENTPSAAVCRRGACTQGFCNGVPDGVGPGAPASWTSPTYFSGCSYTESDTFCEDAWDGCACNGRARCEGTIGPQWSGFSGAEAPILGGLAPNQAELDASLQSCRDRGPTEPTLVSGSPISVPRDVRNGGCELNDNPCSIDGLCCEPDPAGCRMFHVGASLAAPLDTVAVSDLDALCGDAARLITTRFTRSLDGGPSYECVTSVLGNRVPPTDLDSPCRPDGNPCTLESECRWEPAVSQLVCVRRSAPPGPVEEGEPIGFYFDGERLARDLGADCEGDPFATGVPGQTSCFRRQCDGVGSCRHVGDVAICEAEVEQPSCGTLTCTGSGGADSPVARRAPPPGYQGDAGTVVGCGRTDRCVVGLPQTIFTSCVDEGFQAPGTCSVCEPARGDGYRGVLPDGETCNGPCGQCSTGLCQNRDPYPSECLQ